MKLEADIHLMADDDYKPILDFINQFSLLNTHAIFGVGDTKETNVVFVVDGNRAEVVSTQSADIMDYLEDWSRRTCGCIYGCVMGEDWKISMEDEDTSGGFHLVLKSKKDESDIFTLDEYPLEKFSKDKKD